MQTSKPPAVDTGRHPAPLPLSQASELPETVGYRVKNALLGPPLTTEQLGEQRLSKVAALGVLSPDCISSTAYGSEEILRILVPAVGVAAFSLLLPVTLAIIVVLFFVTLSYREVVMAYTKTGGSYMVSRENFGPRVAQVAAAALIIDYTVTVAVQVAAGTAAVTSGIPSLTPYSVEICVAVVLLMAYGNFRGLREASKIFAFPTYFFIFAMSAMVIVGLIRAALGKLHQASIDIPGAVHESAKAAAHPDVGLLMGASVFVLLKSFANGGSSLTGLEAISNGVSAFKPPSGANARRTLVIMATVLGSLVVGVSIIARLTHAVPYVAGTPTVVAQEAKAIFGHSGIGNVFYLLLIVSNVLILYTGGNTSFNGFPFLTSFVANDSFLPRWLTKRGHRLAFSNGITVLTVVGIGLLVASRANVDSLVAVYAIGVFTGFTMAGAGMVRYHRRTREVGWKHRQIVNGFAAVLSGAVVIIFAVTKFTQGAWLVVLLFPILVYGFIRINRRYQREQELLEAGVVRFGNASPMRRHVALLLVDRFDLATVSALRYTKALAPDVLRVVNFRIDPVQTRELEAAWRRRGLSALPLDILDCPDRRIGRATLDLVGNYDDGDTQVSVLLPRRDFSGLSGRLLHDRTADRISLLISEIRHVNAIIVPFQLTEEGATRRLALVAARRSKAEQGDGPAAAGHGGEGGKGSGAGKAASRSKGAGDKKAKVARRAAALDIPGRVPIEDLQFRQRAKVAGLVKSVEIQPRDGIQVLTALLEDETGGISLVFGRGRVDGIEPSARLVAEGMVGEYDGSLAIRNPVFEFLARPSDEPE